MPLVHPPLLPRWKFPAATSQGARRRPAALAQAAQQAEPFFSPFLPQTPPLFTAAYAILMSVQRAQLHYRRRSVWAAVFQSIRREMLSSIQRTSRNALPEATDKLSMFLLVAAVFLFSHPRL
jgi:hypothetical protein